MTTPLPILRGNLEVLVLKALSVSPMHGYALTNWLAQRAGGQLELLDSALYQALYRLEGRRLIKATWGVTDTGRRARFYTVTAAGRTELQSEMERWRRYAKAVSGILASDA